MSLFLTVSVALVSAAAPDLDNDGDVDFKDILIGISAFNTTNSTIDVNQNGKVDIFDLRYLIANFGTLITPPTATPVPPPVSTEWTQFGHDAQRTSYDTVGVTMPWKYKWQWNGADANGKTQSGHLSVPRGVQPITGGSFVYYVAANALYALNKTNGTVAWSNSSLGTLSSTPAYFNGSVYIASGNNNVYKINATNGTIQNTFTGSSSFTLSVLITPDGVYANDSTGKLYKLSLSTLAQQWVYSGNSPSATPVSYSSATNTLVFGTQDLYVHAVNNSNGSQIWRVKPTSHTYQSGVYEMVNGWPVIAEQHGLVFVRYRLDWDTLWTWNPFPTTLSAIRSGLEGNPGQQALFALNLSNGQKAFTPLAGNGGAGDGGNLPMGPQPVISTYGGKEVAYIIWRNGLTCAQNSWCDGREDATMGEMVLDNSTVTGYQAGDIRFIKYEDIQTDEMMNLAASKDIIFHSHWLINSAYRITNRAASYGSTFSNPIQTASAPNVIWRQCNGTNTCNYPGCTGNTYCGVNCAPSASRYCSQGLYSYGDARQYPPGFYEYNNDMQGGSTPYTVISDGMVLVKTQDGGIIALENGNPTASANTAQPLAQAQTQNSVLGTSTAIPEIVYQDASQYMNQTVKVTGKIVSADNHLPKAVYLGFTNPHDGALLIRIFDKDLQKFTFDPLTLKNKTISVTGMVTAYWPDGVDPEIIVTDPSQIVIE